MANQAELRERFNPDGSSLRNHQLRMLEMLKYIDGVCKKHQYLLLVKLRNSLGGGEAWRLHSLGR